MVTDAHYADTGVRGDRYYRESLAKMRECVALMNDRKVAFLIELGDLKDQGEPVVEKETLAYLRVIEDVYGQFRGPRYHVLGNHDVDSLSKGQFLSCIENTGIRPSLTYYSFDVQGCHFVVLDADYKADGTDYERGDFAWTDANIPPEQLDWLREDLSSSSKPVIVCIHQQLDVTGDHGVKNAARVRQVLQDSKKVLAVFQGHYHPGHYSLVQGIHYYTLRAMVDGRGEESSSYATVEVCADNSIVITGYRRALGKTLVKA